MRAHWENLHAGLGRAIRTLRANRAFADMTRGHPELARFGEPGTVVAFLTGRSGDPDAKDRVLATLVHLVQHREHTALASPLLWLGLWPGLDGIYRRRLRHFARAEELVSALGDAFTGIVDRLDLRSVRRVAASLVRSTERHMMDHQKRRWVEDQRIPIVPEETDELGASTWRCSPSPVLGLVPGRSLASELEALRGWLASAIGGDADLLLAVLVFDETQHAAGAELGLSPEASRKRCQRALRRIRLHLEF